jgi:hypothetical protein
MCHHREAIAEWEALARKTYEVEEEEEEAERTDQAEVEPPTADD